MHVPFAIIADLGGAGPLKVAIGSLPDEVLLEIFTFYVKEAYWMTLVYVCRGWRHVVSESPLRLDLRLLVGRNPNVGKLLDIWPALPIVICPDFYWWTGISKVTENVIAALKHRDRVCRISLDDFPIPSQKLETFLEMMRYPFPALTDLKLCEWLDEGEEVAAIPDSFLGGSAPRLRSLRLTQFAFPALPKLLLSANHLVDLYLGHIAYAGYISPEVMVGSLSSMAELRSLHLAFDSPRLRPSQASRRPPPKIRTPLPALTHFVFVGVSEYVEDFVAPIDAPRLRNIEIWFLNQLIFDIPQLSQFINRVERLNELDATVSFSSSNASVELSSETGARLLLRVLCRQADWQLSSVAQLCAMSLPPISTLETLTVATRSYAYSPQHFGQFNIDHGQWVELLYPFTNVKNLYLDEDVGLHTATALQGLIGESVTQVLPELQRLFIKGLQPSGPTWEAAESLMSFVAARRRFGHPIAIHCWE